MALADSLKVLWISPTLPFPATAGNRQHLSQLISSIKARGAKIDFVLYRWEGEAVPDETSFGESFASFRDFARPTAKHKSKEGYWGIDDWVSDDFIEFLAQYTSGQAWDLVMIEYAWMSRVADIIDPRSVVVINAHDVFTDRDKVFRDAGSGPSWFYTRRDEEAYGLSRADVVLAITEDDRSFLQQITGKGTSGSPTVICRRPRLRALEPIQPGPAERLVTMGYIASSNQLNKISISSFLQSLSSEIEPPAPFSVSVAGSISSHIAPLKRLNVARHGVVDDVEAFYSSCDLVIAPMVRGTGAMIKAIEAIDFEMPLIATSHATVGLPVRSYWHSFASPVEMAKGIAGSLGGMTPDERRSTLRSLRYESARIRRQLLSEQAEEDRIMWEHIESTLRERRQGRRRRIVSRAPATRLAASPADRPAVSVIVAAYNTEEYVGECLRSIAADSLRKIEIIVIDDGSTDKTAETALAMADADDRIKVIRQENRGPGPARNRGIEVATGNYIYFVDSDDRIGPDSLSRMHEMSVRGGLDICSPNRPYLRSRPIELISSLPGWCCFIRRSLLQLDDGVILQPDIRSGQDGVFANMVLTRCHKAAVCEAAEYHYTKREDSTFSVAQANVAAVPRLAELHVWHLKRFYQQQKILDQQSARYLLFLQDETYRLRFRKSVGARDTVSSRHVYLTIKMEILDVLPKVPPDLLTHFSSDFLNIGKLEYEEYLRRYA